MLHSKQWHYSLHRDFQNCNSTRRSPTGFFNYNSTRVPIHKLHTENSPSRMQFYIQKTKSSSSTTTTLQRAKWPSIQKRNSTDRRQGDLLEIHPCILLDLPKAFQTFQSFMAFQPIQAILQVPVSPGNPPHSKHSPIRMHILHILQILQFDWFPQKTPPSASWTLQTTNILQTFYKHSLFKEREMLRYRSELTDSPE